MTISGNSFISFLYNKQTYQTNVYRLNANKNLTKSDLCTRLHTYTHRQLWPVRSRDDQPKETHGKECVNRNRNSSDMLRNRAKMKNNEEDMSKNHKPKGREPKSRRRERKRQRRRDCENVSNIYYILTVIDVVRPVCSRVSFTTFFFVRGESFIGRVKWRWIFCFVSDRVSDVANFDFFFFGNLGFYGIFYIVSSVQIMYKQRDKCSKVLKRMHKQRRKRDSNIGSFQVKSTNMRLE